MTQTRRLTDDRLFPSAIARCVFAATLFLVILLLSSGQSLSAQEPEPRGATASEEPESEGPIEADFAISTKFRGGMLAGRLYGPLTGEVHYFGVDDDEVGVIGLAWELHVRELRLIPGAGWAFGSKDRPGPAFSFRWSLDQKHWLTQGLFLQSLRPHVPPTEEEEAEGEGPQYASILDGNHVSGRFGRLDLGFMWERIRYRGEDEWKSGARAAWHVGHGFRVMAQVLGPDPEVRVGFVYEPPGR